MHLPIVMTATCNSLFATCAPSFTLPSLSTFDTTLLGYVVGISALTAWEEYVVPRLKLHSILPDVPLIPGSLNERERNIEWILPWTADSPVPPPTAQNLKRSGRYIVGTVDNVDQYIVIHDTEPPTIRGVCEKSSEWSEHYNETVYIYKSKR